jgi:hypothetical protein
VNSAIHVRGHSTIVGERPVDLVQLTTAIVDMVRTGRNPVASNQGSANQEEQGAPAQAQRNGSQVPSAGSRNASAPAQSGNQYGCRPVGVLLFQQGSARRKLVAKRKPRRRCQLLGWPLLKASSLSKVSLYAWDLLARWLRGCNRAVAVVVVRLYRQMSPSHLFQINPVRRRPSALASSPLAYPSPLTVDYDSDDLYADPPPRTSNTLVTKTESKKDGGKNVKKEE